MSLEQYHHEFCQGDQPLVPFGEVIWTPREIGPVPQEDFALTAADPQGAHASEVVEQLAYLTMYGDIVASTPRDSVEDVSVPSDNGNNQEIKQHPGVLIWVKEMWRNLWHTYRDSSGFDERMSQEETDAWIDFLKHRPFGW